MSLILDALNRAERERKKTQAVPDLQTRHEPAATRNAEVVSHSYGVWLMVLLLVLIIGGYFIWLARTPALELVVPAVPTVVNSSLSSQSSPAANVSPPSATNAQSTALVPAPVIVEPTVAESTAEKTLTSAQERPSKSPGEEASATELAELYASAQQQEIIESQSQAVAAPNPVNRLYANEPLKIEPESKPAVVSERNFDSLIDVPDIGSLPWGFRQEIPSINYARHNFDTGGASTVVINGAAHRAGASLGQGVVLEEIYIDGVIIRFKQTQFKLRALSSWINM